ncbi:hypothetical protein HDG37_007843 [Paraburkholderia sp. MM5384-R2]|nr:hypothetical protein [Paraburkholderia sp. MM5384-R2]
MTNLVIAKHDARSLLAPSQKQAENPSFNGAKTATAQFFAEHVLP